MFVDGLDGLQHVLPVELPLQWIYSFAVSQPRVQIQVSTLHQHVDVAVGYFTANTYKTIMAYLYTNMTATSQLKKKKDSCAMHRHCFWRGHVLTSHRA